MENLAEIYKEFLIGRRYDLPIANTHIGENFRIEVKDLVDVFSKPTTGCCLHHSLAWIGVLRKMDIPAYLSSSLEEDGAMHASVYFIFKGIPYIADVVSDVKNGTSENLFLDVTEFKSEQINNQLCYYNLENPKIKEMEFFKISNSLKIPL